MEWIMEDEWNGVKDGTQRETEFNKIQEGVYNGPECEK